MKDVLADMERLNVATVVSASPRASRNGKTPRPPGSSPARRLSWPPVSVGARRVAKGFHNWRFQGTGRDRASDPATLLVDAYFALAEELDVPVAIHLGTGGLIQRICWWPRDAA
jgi:uncharacterized protein